MSNAPPTPPVSSDCSSEKSGRLSPDSFKTFLPQPPHTDVPTKVLEADEKTPDKWLPRDARLIRLTGNHPFNVEPPLSDLYNQGFLTSPDLFYVRNHGAVPRVEDAKALDWEFSIEGLVEKPMKMTLKQLIEQFEQRTCPVTLVCAGNRRKEQNIVRKSKGFNWGAAGLSTALFTGPMMADVLRASKPMRGAKFVCMEGADKLPNGCYATSVKLNWAMDSNRGFMLAHRMNGEMLRPDHGKPLRVVIPGQIGGRSVKWLKRLIVTREPSDNWYHIYDNRVLPTMISPETAANEPSLWTDERYAIYDLSPNSAIAYPAHGETLSLSDGPDTYDIRGYAYSGGGRRVTRVEISVDKGRSWRLAEINYPEDQYRDAGPVDMCGGLMDTSEQETSFCWCFWNLAVDIAELRKTDGILVRAMDESMNIQPRDLYWNVMGMMNNPWFRVNVEVDEVTNSLQFEHPTQPALYPGGWMERKKKQGLDISNGHWGERIDGEAPNTAAEGEQTEISMTNPDVTGTVSFTQLQEHAIEDSPWFVVDGQVYDGTSFLKEHPGGPQSIESAAGQDVTEEFVAIHSETARAMMKDYHIGSLDTNSNKASTDATDHEQSMNGDDSTSFLRPRSWKKAILHSKTIVSRNTRIFSLKLEHEKQPFGLPIGQHVLLKLRDPATREVIIRPYTPVSSPDKFGFVDILIKVYSATKTHEGGKMSQAIDGLPVGHSIEVKGPLGKFEYLGNGICTKNRIERHVKTFIMISGGTGITPMFQLLTRIMKDPGDKTKCIVLNSNHEIGDILCREDLDGFTVGNKDKYELHYTLTSPSEEWTGMRGRIDRQVLQNLARKASYGLGEAMVLLCGPEPLEMSVRRALLDDGWNDEDVMSF